MKKTTKQVQVYQCEYCEEEDGDKGYMESHEKSEHGCTHELITYETNYTDCCSMVNEIYRECSSCHCTFEWVFVNMGAYDQDKLKQIFNILKDNQ